LATSVAACGGSGEASPDPKPSVEAPGGVFAAEVTAFRTRCLEPPAWIDLFTNAEGRPPTVMVTPAEDQTGRSIDVAGLKEGLEGSVLSHPGIDLAAPVAAMAQLQSMQTLSGTDTAGDGPAMGDYVVTTILREADPGQPDPSSYAIDLRLVGTADGTVICETSSTR
jgi:hypothetical protein